MEPVVVSTGKVHVGALVHVQRRRNVQHTQAPHARWVIDRQAMGHTAPAIVSTQKEIIHIQLVKQTHNVLRHGPLAVIAMVWQPRRM